MHKDNIIVKTYNKVKLNPPLAILIGFFTLIMTGGLLLNLGAVTRSGESIGFINALFTSASASCVTGLTVVNTASYWNSAGQIIILCLIQIGGIGIMSLATIFPLILGKKIDLKNRQLLREQFSVSSYSGIVRLLKYILLFSFSVESIGALILATRFVPRYGIFKGLWYSIFQSVSAFCNAGFDNLGDSIYPFRYDPIVNVVIMALIVIGGLGFLVNQEILRKKSFKKLSVHSKLVLLISAVLILLGALGFFVIEYSNKDTIATESIATKIGQSFFQSVNTRTSGFYSAQFAGLRDATSFLLILLMFIGGSPGSTAGGLKTTTLGVLVLSSFSAIKGENETVVFNRSIHQQTIRKALALVMVSLLLIFSVSFILTIVEEMPFIDILFETVSAYATVGLSKGITSYLSTMSKVFLTITMYLGRVGPLTLGYAISNRHHQSRLRYPDVDIAIG